MQVAAITTNFGQGSTQTTGKGTDLLISGDGFFMVQSGNETLYTRAGAFEFDSNGRLVGPNGEMVQGWNAVDGVVQRGGQLESIQLPYGVINPAAATQSATVTGALPAGSAEGTELVRTIDVYDAAGNELTLTLRMTAQADGNWAVDASTGDPATAYTGTLAFTGSALTAGGAFTVAGIDVDLGAVTTFPKLSTISIAEQDGNAAGTLESYSIANDGSILGMFSNGEQQVLGQVAVATFINPAGLEKAGGSTYRASVNSGAATVGAPGTDGRGGLQTGALEMSNVDLSQEFTNLIVAQRGFQANARIITTSDEVLQELSNLKR
ncbi:flagellar hook protein FlgE [Arenivirga flava]|uniref:Flagellar hook protein FlgE n=1 Tax=Arenivirga flava TaxID=1930060 RepID=A0AA37UGT6_9MICO|nr:flagellar hook protein FlgE [Arenivirga flava]